MIKIKQGNILESTENIICHQVNCQGIMGGGLALQIAKQFSNVEQEYKQYCETHADALKIDDTYKNVKGQCLLSKIAEDKFIANCFTQRPDFTTDYQAIFDCFKTLLEYCKKTNKTICVPYKYGCGIAKGSWKTVEGLFNYLSHLYKIDITIYQLEDKKIEGKGEENA